MGFLEVLLDSGKSGVLNVVVGEGGGPGFKMRYLLVIDQLPDSYPLINRRGND